MTRPTKHLGSCSLLLAVVVLLWGTGAQRVLAAPPTWMTDLRAAHADAVLTDRSLAILVSSPWSTPGQLLDRQLHSDERVMRLLSARFVAVRLDFDHDRRTADILEVCEVPCLVILSPQGDLLGRCRGVVSAERLCEFLEQTERLSHQRHRPSAPSAQPE